CVFVGMADWHNEYLPQIRSTFRCRWSVLRKTGKKFTDTFLSGEALQNSEKANPVSETGMLPSTVSGDMEPEWEEYTSEAKALEGGIELDTTSISNGKEKK